MHNLISSLKRNKKVEIQSVYKFIGLIINWNYGAYHTEFSINLHLQWHRVTHNFLHFVVSWRVLADMKYLPVYMENTITIYSNDVYKMVKEKQIKVTDFTRLSTLTHYYTTLQMFSVHNILLPLFHYSFTHFTFKKWIKIK